MTPPIDLEAAPTTRTASSEPINILDGMFGLAMKDHRQNRLPEAERIYRKILAIDPRHAPALHMLGTLAHQVGRVEIAAQLVASAIGLDPHQAEYHFRMGAILEAQEQLERAEGSFRRALTLEPTMADAKARLDAVIAARASGSGAQKVSSPGTQAGIG